MPQTKHKHNKVSFIKTPPFKRVVRKFGIIAAAIGFLLLASEMALASAFMGSALPGAKLAGEHVMGRERASLVHLAQERTRDYQVTLSGPGTEPVQATASEIGIGFDASATAESVLSRPTSWVLPYFMKQTSAQYGLSYRLNYPKLKAFVERVAGNLHVAATEARVEMVDGQAKVVPEVDGLVLNQEQLLGDVVAAVENRQSAVKLVTRVEEAKIKAPQLGAVVAQADKLAATPVSFSFENRRWQPGREAVGQWLTYSAPNGQPQVAVDTAKVESYLATISRVVDIKAVNKSITLINGEVKAEEGGKVGRAVDRSALAQQVATQLRAGQNLTLAVPTREVAFKTSYNRTISIADGRYVEINLSLQHMWAYQDHQVVYSSAITSGATGAGFPTVQGLFSVKAKQRNRNLNGYAIGYNYNVHVQYWMPFYRDYGMHDASWRSAFGGPDYYYGGSHGCVNMPLATAAWLYGWASVGTPVWVHS